VRPEHATSPDDLGPPTDPTTPDPSGPATALAAGSAATAPPPPPGSPDGGDEPAGGAPQSPAPDRAVALVLTHEDLDRVRRAARIALREPFTRRAWSELAFFVLTAALCAVGLAVVAVTLALGIVFAITFVGLAVMVLSLRTARGVGGVVRHLGRDMLGEPVDDPDPVVGRPGFLGWLQSRLRDRVAWRSVAYLALKGPLTLFGFFFAVSLWWDAFACLLHPLWAGGGSRPAAWGAPLVVFAPGSFDNGGASHGIAVFLAGFVFLLAAPWVLRAFVNLDRLLIRSLLGPDPTALRLRTLEEARTHTVDASAATMRRIERDLHDGTQAQLVALAMRLGMAKEKLAGDPERVDLERVRELVEEAHRGAKEAIVELRDIARGIHPPALDIGLEGALATLAARSAVPTELTVDLRSRPTPAIEAIAYFCVAELLANVAQHAMAGRASVVCASQGTWLRLVVRDDGRGGAAITTVGSSSSGLAGLLDRVHAVDGRLSVVSPPGGPTVVTVDLPLSA
jgi:signal transduction histidine kinase